MDNSKKTSSNVMFLSIIGSIILVLIKGSAGYFGNSFALIADAIESVNDTLSSVFIYFIWLFSLKPADDNHPYGHGKAEPLMTFLVVLFLVGSAVFIIYKSIINIITPHELPQAWTLIVLVPIITWKEIAFRMILSKAKATNSTILKAEAWHQRSDAISSFAAFIGISIAVILGDGYDDIDDWAAICAAGVILYNSYHIFRPALAELMDENIHDDLIADIHKRSIEVKGVLGTEKCLIRKSGEHYFVDLHVIVDGSISVCKGHEISHALEAHLLANFTSVQNVLIHIEPNTCYCKKDKNLS